MKPDGRAWLALFDDGSRVWVCSGTRSYELIDSDMRSQGDFMYLDDLPDSLFKWSPHFQNGQFDWWPAENEQRVELLPQARKLLTRRKKYGNAVYEMDSAIIAGQHVAVMSDGTLKIGQPA